MAAITMEEVKESLSVFDIQADDGTLDKMLEIAGLFDFDADTIVNEWLAYQSTHGCVLNIENLEKLLLEKTAGRNRGRNNQTPSSNRKRKNIGPYTTDSIADILENSIVEDAEEDSLLTAYGTPGRAQSKDSRMSITTPRSSVKKTCAYPASTPTSVFSPSTLSPSTSSQKYGSRNNRGEVVASLGPSSDAISTHRSERKSISIVKDRKKISNKSYKYMFQKLVDLSDVMDDAIETMAEAIRLRFPEEIEAFTACTMPSQEPVCVAGRICCDQGAGVGRLNAQSVLLQGSRFVSGGKSILVDLSNLQEFSIFPGQIVVMKGTNPTGRKFLPTKIFTSGSNLLETKNTTTDPISIIIAAGPFTTSDCLSYEPLNDLLKVVKSQRPDVTYIVGPIADIKHEDLKPEKLSVPYEDFFQERLNFIAEKLQGFTQVVFTSSAREAGCHPVYPQPPYRVAMQAKDVHFVRDPSVLEIEGLNVAVTSTDILLHLGAEEICKVTGKSDRLGRLAGHILQQRSFYPLCPSNENISVDWLAAEQLSGISSHPDILVLPSDLKCFVKRIEGCVCINPGRLAKGLTGGTYAQVLVEPSGTDTTNFVISAQVVKI